MKKIFLGILLFPFFSFLSPDYKSSDFIGKWQGEDKGDIGYVLFDSAGYASFEMGGEVLGGKEYSADGKRMSMQYKIDDTADPIRIDLILTNLQTKEQQKMLCIAILKDIDNMVLAIDFGNKRPTEFNEENSILLKRVK